MSNNTKLEKNAYSDIDAVHPRFKHETVEEVTIYEKENYYYCQQCRLYFAPTSIALFTHFTNEIKVHKSCGVCLYCKGKVFEYYQNETSFIFHNCRDCNTD